MRAGAAIAASALFFAAFPSTASADTLVVRPGESIQDAIDAADPGSTIEVLPGTYRENVNVTKDGIKLRGRDAKLLPPAEPRQTRCGFAGAISGICVRPQRGDPSIEGLAVSGFTVEGFSDSGITAISVDGLTVENNVLAGNDFYGAGIFTTTDLRLNGNRALRNGFAGLYVGHTEASSSHIVGNDSRNNDQYGLFVRDADEGRVAGNTLTGNCVGALFQDSADWDFTTNDVFDNDRACSSGDEPLLAGIGVALASTRSVTVESNRITDHNASVNARFSGGVVVVRLFGDDLVNNHVTENFIQRNRPYDIFWDGSGRGNVFADNACRRSSPERLCS